MTTPRLTLISFMIHAIWLLTANAELPPNWPAGEPCLSMNWPSDTLCANASKGLECRTLESSGKTETVRILSLGKSPTGGSFAILSHIPGLEGAGQISNRPLPTCLMADSATPLVSLFYTCVAKVTAPSGDSTELSFALNLANDLARADLSFVRLRDGQNGSPRLPLPVVPLTAIPMSCSPITE